MAVDEMREFLRKIRESKSTDELLKAIDDEHHRLGLDKKIENEDEAWYGGTVIEGQEIPEPKLPTYSKNRDGSVRLNLPDIEDD